MAAGRRDGARPARRLRTGRAGQGHAAPVGLALAARRRWVPRRGGRPPPPCGSRPGRRRRPAGGRRPRGDAHRDGGAARLGGPGVGRDRCRGGAQRHRAVARQALRDRHGGGRRCGGGRGPRPRRPQGDGHGRRAPARRGRLGHRHPARSRARSGGGCPATRRGRLAAGSGGMGAAEHDPAAGVEEAASGPAPDRCRRRRPGAGAGRPRRRDAAGRQPGGADRHPLRDRARPRGQGGPRHQPLQGHRLRHGLAGRAHPGTHPRQVGHRRRGAEPDPPARLPARHPRGEGDAADGLLPPAGGGHGPRHRRDGP